MPTDDYGDSPTSAGLVTVGTPIVGTIEATGDDDWFRVTLEPGAVYRVHIGGSGSQEGTFAGAMLLYLADSTGRILEIGHEEQLTNYYRDGTLYFIAPTEGDYYVSVRGIGYSDPVTIATGTYSLSVSNLGDPSQSPSLRALVLARQDLHWQYNLPINYTFMETDPAENAGYNVAFSPFTSQQRQQAQSVLELISDIVPITFAPFLDNGHRPAGEENRITFHNTGNTLIGNAGGMVLTGGGTGVAGVPGHLRTAEITISASLSTDEEFGSFGRHTIMHEILHGLGLSHPGNYDTSAVFSTDHVYDQDTWQYTVMSYFPASNSGANFSQLPSTPMIDDIAALQLLYGANYTSRASDTVYGFNSNAGRSVYDFTVNTAPIIAIWDGGGRDTIDLSGFVESSRIDLHPGSFSDARGMTGNISIAYEVDIENAIGGLAADTLIGNDLSNHLNGGGGSDVLLGGVGSDLLIGGGGNDILIGGGGSSTAPDYMYGGVGNDTYTVNSAMAGPQDLVDEGEGQSSLAGSASDVDTIISQGALFWDFFSVGEKLFIDRATGGQIVGGKNVLMKEITGSDGDDIILTYGHSSRVDTGPGTDAVSFGLLGLAESYDGVNTLIGKAGNGLDYLYEFESGVDKIDLSAFGYGLTGAIWKSFLVDVDNGDNDYCFLWLGTPGDYLVFIGATASQVQASDFLG